MPRLYEAIPRCRSETRGSGFYNPFVNILLPFQTSRETWAHVVDRWGDKAYDFVREDVPRLIGILILTAFLIWILRKVSDHLLELSRRDGLPSGIRAQQLRTMSGVVRGVGFFVIAFIAVTQVFQALGIDVKPLLASAGVVGLAIGFGAQTLVKDVLNGAFILIENQYDVGDTVKLGTVQGTVEMMTLRRTVLRDADGTVHVVPNSTITIVSNLTRDWTQLTLHVSVDYKEDSDRIIKLLNTVASEIRNDPAFQDSIVADPQVPGIDKVHATEVDYLVLVKTRPGQQYAVAREMRRRIKHCFELNNIQPGGQNRMYVVDSSMPGAKTNL